MLGCSIKLIIVCYFLDIFFNGVYFRLVLDLVDVIFMREFGIDVV